jgi:hypothetical protein
MTKQEMLKNDQWFKQIARMSKSWFWPDAGESYEIINGKFSPMTERGRKLLKQITTSEFHQSMIS